MAFWNRKPVESRDSLENPSTPLYAAIVGADGDIGGATGAVVTPQRAMRVVAFLACVKLLAETIAALPIDVFERENGKRVVSEDERGDLLDDPNPEMTGFAFWLYVVMSMCVWGSAYVWIETDDSTGKPVALWPLAPHKVHKHRENGKVRWFVDGAGWLFDVEVMHFHGVGLEASTGLANISEARNALGISMAAEDYAGRLFQNDGNPGAVYSTEKPMTDEQFNQFKSRIDAAHTGLRNSHKWALLPPGMTYEASSFDPTNMQMLEARKFQVREIARLMRVPPHMIGDLEGSATFASVEQMSIDFVTYTIRPWLVNIQQVVRRKLFSFGNPDKARGFFVEHDVSMLLRADSVSLSKIDAVDRFAGIKTANEVREARGLPPHPGGDVLWTPVNQQVTGADGLPEQVAAVVNDQPAPATADPNGGDPK